MDFVRFLQEQAFGGLDVGGHTVDLQGWMAPSFATQVTRALETCAPDPGGQLRIIEVGSWKGLSASTMARLCAERGIDARIIAVDTWLGAPEFWTWGRDDPTRGQSLNMVHGWPTVFHTFTKNMKSLGLDGVIAPFPISSVQGADVLASVGFDADIVYVDASHEYRSVFSDLEAFYPLLKSGGVMLGDDYDPCNWPGVVRAVDEFCAAHGVRVDVDGVVWCLQKP